MNWKKLILAFIAVYVVLVITELIIHAGLLGEGYRSIANQVFREPQDMKRWAFYVSGIIFAWMFVWIYSYGVQGKGVIEGFRYGIYVGIFYIIVNSMVIWSIIRIPTTLVWSWIILGLIQMIILGLVVGIVYRPKPIPQ